MKRTLAGLLAIVIVFLSGCQVGLTTPIEGVHRDVYQRGMEFIRYLDQTPMIGQKEGEDRLNAIAPDNAPDGDALLEDVIYILWIYHNLKAVESAAVEINAYRSKLGVKSTVQEEYAKYRQLILDARTQADLWKIWNDTKRKN